MNRLRCAGLTGLYLLVIGVAAQGQDARREERPSQEKSGILPGPPPPVLEKLNLSDEQQKKIAQLQREFVEKHRADFDRFRAQSQELGKQMDEARRAKDKEAFEKARKRLEELAQGMRKLEDDLDARIAGVLNEEQARKLKEIKRAASAPPPAPPPTQLLMIPEVQKQLGLSAEQKKKLADLRKEYEEKMTAVLSAEQRKKLEDNNGRARTPEPVGEKPNQ